MITNINYVGQVSGSIDHLPFRTIPPFMYVRKCHNFTLVMFKSGKCRLMGCKHPLQTKIVQVDDLLLSVSISRIQSVSVSFDVGAQLSLSQLGNFCHRESIRYMFEPELFPALRLSHFDPLCINVFASGKCTILGLKHLCFRKFIKRVTLLINRSECLLQHQPKNNANKSIRENGFASIERDTTKTQGVCETEGGASTHPTATSKTTRQWTKEEEEQVNSTQANCATSSSYMD